MEEEFISINYNGFRCCFDGVCISAKVDFRLRRVLISDIRGVSRDGSLASFGESLAFVISSYWERYGVWLFGVFLDKSLVLKYDFLEGFSFVLNSDWSPINNKKIKLNFL